MKFSTKITEGSYNMSSTNTQTGRFPIVTCLPGLAGKEIALIFGSAGIDYAKFVGKNGQAYDFRHIWQSHNDLMINVSDGSLCQFLPWPQLSGQTDYANFFCAQGLYVVNTQQGIATAIYLYARLILAEQGFRLAPSENQTPDGMALWSVFDPTIQWLSIPSTGGHRPDLTGRSPP